MKKLLAIALLSAPALSAPYLGANTGFIDSNHVTGITAGFGNELAIEGRAAIGNDESLLGGYIKLQADASFSPYLLMGYSTTKHDSGPSWGAGVAYEVEQGVYVDADYMAYTGYFQPDVGGVNISLIVKW